MRTSGILGDDSNEFEKNSSDEDPVEPGFAGHDNGLYKTQVLGCELPSAIHAC